VRPRQLRPQPQEQQPQEEREQASSAVARFSIAVRQEGLEVRDPVWADQASSPVAVPCIRRVRSPAVLADQGSARVWAHVLALDSGLALVSAPEWADRDWRRLRLLAMRRVRPDLARAAAVASSTPRPKKAR
jgi:hypothetical protein